MEKLTGMEMKEKIILHLGTNDLLALSSTNKEFFKLCTAPKLWSAKPTGHNLLWGYDSERVLARLNMKRYRDLQVVTISSRYGHCRPMGEWVKLLTAIQTLPKLLSLNLECDLSTVEPWLLADLITTTHCVSLEMCHGVDYDKQIAVIESLADPISVTRHLTLKDLDLRQAMPHCRSMLDALKLLWSIEIYDRCLNESQLRVLRLAKSSGRVGCARRDFIPGEKCRFHSRAREEELDASFARFWANAEMNN